MDAGSAVESLAWIIAKDGRVVATGSETADQTDPTADPTAWEYGGTRSLTFADNLTTCGSSGPLAPGSYQVWLLGDVPARLQPSTATWDNAGVVVGPITLVLSTEPRAAAPNGSRPSIVGTGERGWAWPGTTT